MKSNCGGRDTYEFKLIFVSTISFRFLIFVNKKSESLFIKMNRIAATFLLHLSLVSLRSSDSSQLNSFTARQLVNE